MLMAWDTGILWDFANSNVGLALVAGLLTWIGSLIYRLRPNWKKYEGAIIYGIRLAEKQVPDGSSNSALAKLDTALKYVLRVYEEMNGKAPSKKMEDQLREGIVIVHDRLETSGALAKSKPKG